MYQKWTKFSIKIDWQLPLSFYISHAINHMLWKWCYNKMCSAVHSHTTAISLEVDRSNRTCMTPECAHSIPRVDIPQCNSLVPGCSDYLVLAIHPINIEDRIAVCLPDWDIRCICEKQASYNEVRLSQILKQLIVSFNPTPFIIHYSQNQLLHLQ